MHALSGDPVARPKCPVCEGTGEIDAVSFVNPRKSVRRTCGHCHGRKVVAYKVDIYDVLETLARRAAMYREVSAGLAPDMRELAKIRIEECEAIWRTLLDTYGVKTPDRISEEKR